MGQSTDGLVAFGFDLGEQEELPEALLEAGRQDGDGFEWQSVVSVLTDLTPPGVEWEDTFVQVYRDYWAKQREATENHPLEMVCHCSGECPMWFLAVRGTVTRAKRGFPQPVEMPAVSDEAIKALHGFCERFGLKWQEPRWHVFSMWD